MSTTPPKVIGLTGGIGAGKSAVARLFKKQGIPVLSADTIAREILATGTPGLARVIQQFGAQMLQPDGQLDRQKLRSLITQNPQARIQLDAITHPLIQEKSQSLIQAALDQGAPFVIYEAPLLFEAKSNKKMDFVICVSANDQLRIQRTMLRDGVNYQQALELLNAQMPQTEKMKLSDCVIENNGTEAELESRAQEIIDLIPTR
jgi:dephospho-CoA kinase